MDKQRIKTNVDLKNHTQDFPGGKKAVQTVTALTDDTGALISASNPLPVDLTITSSAEKAEDSAHSSGQVGTFILGVRNENWTHGAGTDGDYSPIAVGEYGQVYVSSAIRNTSQAAFSYAQGFQSAIAVDDKGTVYTRINTALPAGENHIGAVGGNTFSLAVTQTTNASAYEAGDAVGGKITITNAMRVSSGTGVLQSIDIIDKANQKAAMELIIFNADPTAATITDDTAFAYSTDISKQIARIPISASDYVTIDSIATVSLGGLGRVLKASGTNLYAALVTTGTPTYTSTSDIIITFGILQD